VNIDVLNAQTQLYQTRRDLAKARYDVIVKSLRLRQAAGRLQPAAIGAAKAAGAQNSAPSKGAATGCGVARGSLRIGPDARHSGQDIKGPAARS